ncbi:MAG: HEAT repeat domain-containing protein [Acidobacteria bacterium]|nr:HEAT repeat domain-containing protein [Acidobacteriota bacterium]MBI3656254.1 HEAT repeat domain-containing protein [Acidobacteriota bacterium]
MKPLAHRRAIKRVRRGSWVLWTCALWISYGLLIPCEATVAANAETVEDLLTQLHSPAPFDRLRAVEKLGNLRNGAVIPQISRLMTDTDAEVRYGATKALGQLHAISYHDAIVARLNDESPLVRIAGAEALARLGRPESVPALLPALQDRNSNVRAQAAKALGHLRAQAAESALLGLCYDPDPDVRVAGMQALVKLRSRAASDPINTLLKDRDDNVRAVARKSLRELRSIWAHIGLVLLAILPALFMLQRYHRMDWVEPEPTVKVYEAFSLGVASAGLASWINFLMQQAFPILATVLNPSSTPPAGAILLTAASAGGIEEGCKFLVMSVFIWRWADFDERFDGILYAAAVGLGFAAYENLYYVLELGSHVGILRALLSVPIHATCGILMGYFFGLAKYQQMKWSRYPKRLLLYGYGSAALFHSIWDAIAFQREVISVFFFLLVTLFAVWLRRKVLRQFSETA